MRALAAILAALLLPAVAEAAAVTRAYLGTPAELAPKVRLSPARLRSYLPYARRLLYWHAGVCGGAAIAWSTYDAPDPTGALAGCGGAVTNVRITVRDWK